MMDADTQPLETLLQASVDLAAQRKCIESLHEECARKERQNTLLRARIRILEARLERYREPSFGVAR